MKKILIVEDNASCTHLIAEIIRHVFQKNVAISYATTLNEALPQIHTADLVVTDYDFPGKGFPALLPILQKEQRQFILQTASVEHLKMYDPLLQLGAIAKGADFTLNMVNLLRSMKI